MGNRMVNLLEWIADHMMITDNNSPFTGFWNGCVGSIIIWILIGGVLCLGYLLFIK